MTDWIMKRYNDELKEIYGMYGEKRIDVTLESLIMGCLGEDFLKPICENEFSDKALCLCFDHKLKLIEIFLDMRNDYRRYLEEINKMEAKGFQIRKRALSVYDDTIRSFLNRYRHRILNFLYGDKIK
jgi:hypothetical protein